MILARLQAAGVRNLAPVHLQPGAGFNFFIGPNASGKTSLLESVYLLGRGRSFRTTQISQMIRFGEPGFQVTGHVIGPGGRQVPVGLAISRGQREIHLDGRAIQSSAELIRNFPLLVIQPSGIALLEGQPKFRRQFLDFGGFHQTPAYLGHWRSYSRALDQRNLLLRQGRIRELAPWTHELARYGIMIHAARSAYIGQLEPVFRAVADRFFPESRFGIRLQAGWDQARALDEVLEGNLITDTRYGHTQSGPHKGDFSIVLDGRPIKAFLSRGQTKLLVYALLLAQSQLMESHIGETVCVLIDDVTSELDPDNRRTLLGLLGDRPAQYFISATTRDVLEDGPFAEAAVYHMERGCVRMT